MTSLIEVHANITTDGDIDAVHRRWQTFLSSLQYTEAKVLSSDYFVYEESGTAWNAGYVEKGELSTQIKKNDNPLDSRRGDR
jgi:hypothetical protein